MNWNRERSLDSNKRYLWANSRHDIFVQSQKIATVNKIIHWQQEFIKLQQTFVVLATGVAFFTWNKCLP